MQGIRYLHFNTRISAVIDQALSIGVEHSCPQESIEGGGVQTTCVTPYARSLSLSHQNEVDLEKSRLSPSFNYPWIRTTPPWPLGVISMTLTFNFVVHGVGGRARLAAGGSAVRNIAALFNYGPRKRSAAVAPLIRLGRAPSGPPEAAKGAPQAAAVSDKMYGTVSDTGPRGRLHKPCPFLHVSNYSIRAPSTLSDNRVKSAPRCIPPCRHALCSSFALITDRFRRFRSLARSVIDWSLWPLIVMRPLLFHR
jgi:hypothetical protein